MRQETCWANTDKAIVQEWQAGTQGRRRLVTAAEESVQSPELRDFLEGMDPTNEEPEPMSSKGFLRTLSRTFFFTVPSYRVRYSDGTDFFTGIRRALRILKSLLVHPVLLCGVFLHLDC